MRCDAVSCTVGLFRWPALALTVVAFDRLFFPLLTAFWQISARTQTRAKTRVLCLRTTQTKTAWQTTSQGDIYAFSICTQRRRAYGIALASKWIDLAVAFLHTVTVCCGRALWSAWEALIENTWFPITLNIFYSLVMKLWCHKNQRKTRETERSSRWNRETNIIMNESH